MDHQNRGICHIFSHSTFDAKLGLPERTCARMERNTVSKTYRKLGFQTQNHMDYTRKKIMKTVRMMIRRNYTKDDCICICVMTHGGRNGKLYAKDGSYNIDIFEKAFDAMKTLKNKPKLLFVQACRGGNGDREEDTPRFCYSSSSSDETDWVTNMKSAPTKADILIAHSTCEGYVSFQQWFFPTLCKNLNKFREVCDLDEILTKTIDIVSTYVSHCTNIESKKFDKCKQVPVVVKTLRKKIYFRKK
ncbi:hypothetical protein QAD02_011527 [Eretmocerus hayati]|uniref:Uncharacterized protein n=1 Tax=Eretmocerus hayati TaxID=131215 RepID=A0ACC2NX65_9HYME|nr:hypothetical protein QAD02_011527 [Eretmocerus hayati]